MRERKVCPFPSDTCTCEWCRAERWDGKQFIGKNISGGVIIPTGCVSMFITIAKVSNNDMEITNDRIIQPELPDVDWSLKRTPRQYQNKTLEAILTHGRGIVKSPTASGKSMMMAMLISTLKRTTIIKVPRLVIMDQIRNEIIESLNIEEEEIGTIGRSKYNPSLITITTTNSLSNLLKKPKQWADFMSLHRQYGWGLLIEDEVHRGASKTSYETTMKIDAFYRVGFSATPLMREDNENLKIVAGYGDIIQDVKKQELVDGGWLIAPSITFLSVKPIPTVGRDRWADVYNMGIVFNKERNRKIIDIVNEMFKNNKSTLIFVDRIDHGNEILSMCKSYANHEVEFVFADNPKREELLARFKNKELKTLISTTGIIGEGFDFRGLDAAIIGDGGKSVIETLQKMGRGMRPEEGKKEFLLFDFGDRGKYISDHARRRKVTYMASGFNVDVSETPYLK